MSACPRGARHGTRVVVTPIEGGVGKKGKAGLLGRASDLKTALKEKERLYFVEHRHGNQTAKANGVTFEGAVPDVRAGLLRPALWRQGRPADSCA